MDLLTVLSTCSLAKDFGLVLSMTMSFSHGEPYTVRAAVDATDAMLDAAALDGVETAPHTREAALSDMRRIKQPLIGLLPVPPEWAAMYQATPEELLDPCVNVSVATAQLSLYERQCAGRGRKARSCALHAYSEAAGIPFFEFAVLESLREQHLPSNSAPVLVESNDVLGASLLVDDAPSARPKGADRILVFVDSPLDKSPERGERNNKSHEKAR
jgi:hypothetical protein